MSRIFLSYASEDRARVQPLIRLLESVAPVWWDHEIPHGSLWDEEIEKAMAGAGCVVVVWTRNSVASRWVRAEARAADARRILVPVMLDEVAVPLQFTDVETAQLQGWTGGRDHPEIEPFLRSVKDLLARAPAAAPPGSQPPPPPTDEKPPRRVPAWLARPPLPWAAAGALALSVAVYAALPNREPNNGGPGTSPAGPVASAPGSDTGRSGGVPTAPGGTGAPQDTAKAATGQEQPGTDPAPDPGTQTPPVTGGGTREQTQPPQPRPERRIESIVISETMTPNLRMAIDYLSQDSLRRGYHYLVDTTGVTTAFFNEAQFAAHTTRHNRNSLGIGMVYMTEPIARGMNRPYRPYTPQQIDSLVVLLADLAQKYGIGPRDIYSKGELDPNRPRDITAHMTDIRIRVGQILRQRGAGN